jgi:hypothetical protein
MVNSKTLAEEVGHVCAVPLKAMIGIIMLSSTEGASQKA